MEPSTFLLKAYDETLGLLVEARNYLSNGDFRKRQSADAFGGLTLSCEALRLTARLTQVMAWLMVQRAASNGEITREEALSERNRLSGADVCLDERAAGDETLPAGLRSLLERSLSLYRRIARIEAQMWERISP